MENPLNHRIDGRALVGRIRNRPIPWLIAVGLIVRLVEYARDRSAWMDESSLAANIVGHSPFEPPGLLVGDQLAPFGFLVAERLVVAILGGSYWAMRLIPLAVGLAAVPLFARLARRNLPGRGALWAIGLFALSDALIYFSSELKPYIVDVAASLVVLNFPTTVDFAAYGLRRKLGLAALGGVLVWFSFPVTFVMAGVGLGWMIGGLRARSWPIVIQAASLAMSWLASFLGSYAVGRILIGPRTGMWAFWVFAFPEPRVGSVIAWLPMRLVNFFANPLHFDTPIGVIASAYLGLGIAVLGAIVLGRRQPEMLGRLLAPVGIALVAGATASYPFHGRLVLFLAPIAYLLLGCGLGVIGERLGRFGRIALVAFVFAWPLLEIIAPMLEPRTRPFSPFGDLRIDPFRPLPPFRPPVDLERSGPRP